MCAAFSPCNSGEDFSELQRALVADAGAAPFDLAVILGSGWSHLARTGRLLAKYAYCDWPWFPDALVAGHSGHMAVISSQGRRILCFAGRFHCYQGLSAFAAAVPVRIAAALGCPKILLTCAAGAINPQFETGDFVWITDHINLLGDNPLRGLQNQPFIDLSQIYAQAPLQPLRQSAANRGISLHSGILAALAGPSYETPAEVRMLERLGVDLVSMSMVHEAIMAAYLGLEIAGLSLVTNQAAGVSRTRLSHDEVLACAKGSQTRAEGLFSFLSSIWIQE